MNRKEKYPEYPLNGRIKLVLKWIPQRVKTILDGGCAYGYGTRFLKQKAKEVYGVDPNKEFINIAKERYPYLNFQVAKIEKTSFSENFFDIIILSDVFEHVEDEIKTLDEIYRIMKPSGRLIMSTPHKGLFGFMDTDNYAYILKKYSLGVYKFLFKIKGKNVPAPNKPGYTDKHRHYNLKDFKKLLNQSKFKDKYEIKKVFRSGFFLGPLNGNILLFFTFVFNRKIANVLTKPFEILSKVEYWIPFGPLAYNIAIEIKKKKKDL